MARSGRSLRLHAGEASGFLVGPPVFNTGEAEYLGLAGSIPVRLRHVRVGHSTPRPHHAQAGVTDTWAWR